MSTSGMRTSVICVNQLTLLMTQRCLQPKHNAPTSFTTSVSPTAKSLMHTEQDFFSFTSSSVTVSFGRPSITDAAVGRSDGACCCAKS